MKYRLIILPHAKDQLYSFAKWWAENCSIKEALRWLNGFEKALNKITDSPNQYPLASEDEQLSTSIFQVNYGIGKRKTHRALFEICDHQIVIHSIRHLAQDDLTDSDF